MQAPALWHLDLSDNVIRDAGARELALRLATAPHATMSLRRNNVTAAAAAALSARAPKAAILDCAGAGLPPVDLSDGAGPESCPEDRSGALMPVRRSRHLALVTRGLVRAWQLTRLFASGLSGLNSGSPASIRHDELMITLCLCNAWFVSSY